MGSVKGQLFQEPGMQVQTRGDSRIQGKTSAKRATPYKGSWGMISKNIVRMQIEMLKFAQGGGLQPTQHSPWIRLCRLRLSLQSFQHDPRPALISKKVSYFAVQRDISHQNTWLKSDPPDHCETLRTFSMLRALSPVIGESQRRLQTMQACVTRPAIGGSLMY